MDLNKKIRQLTQLLLDSENTIVFTGAGMSTESGLPDFRSPQGLWRGLDPRRIASLEAFCNNREDFYRFYRRRITSMLEVKPNPGHYRLARWEGRGLVKGVITQNVDRLHSLAGSQRVVELHGNLHQARCSRCGVTHSSRLLLEDEHCPHCNGYLRPAVVLFGECLEAADLEAAEDMTRSSELFVVLGSSLEVSPANWFPRLARQIGARLVIINNAPTMLDSMADLLLPGQIGRCLAAVDALLEEASFKPGRGLKPAPLP